MATQTSIRASEDALFSRWRAKYDQFIEDGVVDEEGYLGARRKILFVLKEVNDEEGSSWDLRGFLSHGSLPQTWNNVARWVFGVLNDPAFPPWSKVPQDCNDKFRTDWLRFIAAVNLKKVGGGGSAHATALLDFVQKDRDYLRGQLFLYKPDITICCGTAEYLPLILTSEEIGDWQITSNGIAYASSKMLGRIVRYYHPQAHYPANFLYTMLIDSLQEMLSADAT